MNNELSELKQEVAELWARYRKEEPRSGDDEGRRALAELNRSLEAKRRALADRSSTLRLELEAHRRRASQLAPAVRVFGGLIGCVVALAIVGSLMPELASVELSVGQGAVALCVALVLTALSVARTDG